MKIDINSNKGVLVLPVYSEKGKLCFFDDKKNKEVKEKAKSEAKSYNFEGKKEEPLFFKIGNEKILLIGLKERYEAEDLRRSYSVVCRTLKLKKESIATIEVPLESETEIKAIVEGLDLTDYKFDRYIRKKEEKDVELSISLDVNKKFTKIIEETLLVDRNVKFVRDIVNENSNIIIPERLAEYASDFAKKHKLNIKILDEKQIQKEGLNLLWAVGQGSHHPPRLVIVEYNGNPQSKEIIALVGKGITFDTGGTNLKPAGSKIEEMKEDMAGAAACMGAFMTAVEFGMKKNLILVMSCAENSISGHSCKPGDLFVSYSGIGVEIGNTDAEGRLVLADAIGYVQKNYKPTKIIDLATLTGAILIALGKTLIGLFGNDEKLLEQLFKAGEVTAERTWKLPIYDEHRDEMKSKFADIKNNGPREGGSITGAAFIERFVNEGIKWAHLDIAGAVRGEKDLFYVPEAATGKGVRLLLEFLKND